MRSYTPPPHVRSVVSTSDLSRKCPDRPGQTSTKKWIHKKYAHKTTNTENMKMQLVCMGCLKPLQANGYSYTPCCHSFCEDCKEKDETQCAECDESSTFVFKNKLLSDFSRKITFIEESLGQIKSLNMEMTADTLTIKKSDNINKLESIPYPDVITSVPFLSEMEVMNSLSVTISFLFLLFKERIITSFYLLVP